MMKQLKSGLLLLVAISLLSSCNNSQKKKKTDEFRYQDSTVLSDIEVTKSFIYLFPAPGEVLDRFYDAEIPYSPELLHDPKVSDRYLTNEDKGLNMGIYLADVAYSALFSRTSEAVEYLDAIQDLGNEMNISNSTYKSLLTRARKNLGNRDSLVSLSNDVFYNMVEFLENSSQEQTIAVISFGAYVESLYLAVNSIEKYEKGHPIIQQITELKYPMENLLSQAEAESDNPSVQAVITYLDEINEIYSRLASESSTAEVQEPGVINLTGGAVEEMNRERFNEMKTRVISIRNNIVETN